MARFEAGWIKVHRSAYDGDLGSNPLLFGLWIALLCMATWKPSKIIWQGKQREIPPGTVLFGIKELAERWGCSRSVLRKWLNYLHYTQRISLESCSRGTLVTICNWTTYQSADDEPCEPSVSGVRTACAPSVHGEPLSKEERKKKEEGKNLRAASTAADAPVSAASWLAYATAWSKRHGGTPLRDRQANAQLKKFVERVGQADAPAIAAFYVTHNDAFYVRNRHPISLLLAQVERIRADWQAGRGISQVEAKQAEAVDSYAAQIERVSKAVANEPK